jgi:hypothetical protein
MREGLWLWHPPQDALTLTRATLSRSQADLVLVLLTKRVRESSYLTKNTRLVEHKEGRKCLEWGVLGTRILTGHNTQRTKGSRLMRTESWNKEASSQHC